VGRTRWLTERVEALETLVGYLLLHDKGIENVCQAIFTSVLASEVHIAHKAFADSASCVPALLERLHSIVTNQSSGRSSSAHPKYETPTSTFISLEDDTSPAQDPVQDPALPPRRLHSPMLDVSTETPLVILANLSQNANPPPDSISVSGERGHPVRPLEQFSERPPARLWLGPSSVPSHLLHSALAFDANPSPRPLPRPLPPDHLINVLLDLYLNQTVHRTFPMIDRQQLLLILVSSDTGASNSIPFELAYAVMASAAAHAGFSISDYGLDSWPAEASQEYLLARAREEVTDALESPTLATVQALNLLVICDLGQGQHALAAADLGKHT
jgi:hypothetical protein